MPIYLYKDNTSGAEVEVVRNFSELDELPTYQECSKIFSTEEQYMQARWERLISGGQQLVKGQNWGPGKGYW